MKGFLLINLGSPDSTSIPDVKKYLDEFLMDKRVIGKSYWFRWFLVKIIILNTRPRKSAKAYKKIWWKEGSPLIVLSKRLFEKIKKLVKIPIALAMRYGSISIVKGLKELNDYGVKEVVVLPLYPHYAMSSYETVVEKVKKEVELNFPSLKLKIIKPFYKNKNYIKLLSNKIKETISKIEYDHILFSYHGIPVSHLKISDPTNKHCYKIKNCCSVSSQAHETCYKHQVLETTELVVKELKIDKDKYSNAFQSRLPNEAWLKPYTDNELERLAKK
jgi:ferrochelatase